MIAIDAKAAAALFDLKERTWRRLNASGAIPAPLTIGGSVRWLESELRAWAEAGSPTRTQWELRKQSARNSD